MTELLPCPWCGAAARLEADTDGSVCVEVDHEPECYLTSSDTRRWFYADEHGRSAEEVAASEWNLRGGGRMKAYVVRREEGCYSDLMVANEGVFSTREAAERHVRSHSATFTLLSDGTIAPYCQFEDYDDAIGTVTRRPVGRGGGCWRIGGDPRYGAPSWFIEEWEVAE